MINMQILFFVAEIGISKNKNLIFHVIFLNKDISVTTLDITMKFSMTALHIHSEGSVSQIFYLGPSFYFMLFRKKCFENIQKVARFLRLNKN